LPIEEQCGKTRSANMKCRDGEAVKCIIEKSPRRQSVKFRSLDGG